MAVSLLSGRTLTRVVEDVETLLSVGEVSSPQLRDLCGAERAGLWSDGGAHAVATSEMVGLGNALPSFSEALPALFSLVPQLRTAWLRVVLARLREIGERSDIDGLCDAVAAAGPLATELVAGVEPSLAPTAFGEIERRVLPIAAHEAQAFPILLRALAATSPLADASPTSRRRSLAEIVWEDPSQTWQHGRLIRLPSANGAAPTSAVLTGTLDDSAGDGDPMRWALHRPWAFLLAQMVFTKEAWEAERVSGSLAFELEQAHVAVFQSPPRVDVVVTLPTGEEVRCGSLGDFTLQTLAQLGVTVLAHRVTASMLDDRLALVVEALLRREVWRFDHGTGGRRPGYAIHPAFSDACYRALGSRAFYRLGSPVTAAVRRVAETWARERVARAGAPTAGGAAT